MPKAARTNTTKQIIPADPIIAAIATHKRLERHWLSMSSARDAATEAGVSGPSESEIDAVFLSAQAAAWTMAEIKPATVAGAAAMLKYLTRDPTNGLFELGEVPWLETALWNLERGLKKLARESCLAQAA